MIYTVQATISRKALKTYPIQGNVLTTILEKQSIFDPASLMPIVYVLNDIRLSETNEL